MNPYAAEGPAIVSFSGGRTSAFMLAQILDACGGQLPDDVHVTFCNTGLEHPATYEFVHQVEQRWCHVHWLEYAIIDDAPSYQCVTYETASRRGEPFTALIERKNMLPNPVARICTANLKIRTMARFCKHLGWETWDNYVGLRADEPRRVAKLKGDIKAEQPVCPMARAGHTIQDVLRFWREQDFDLDLPWKDVGVGNSFGNCVGCFLKGRRKLEELMKVAPEHFEWWLEAEARQIGGAESKARTFHPPHKRPPYAALMALSKRQGRLFDLTFDDDETIPCMCTD